jgi:hypothetical protein
VGSTEKPAQRSVHEQMSTEREGKTDSKHSERGEDRQQAQRERGRQTASTEREGKTDSKHSEREARTDTQA